MRKLEWDRKYFQDIPDTVTWTEIPELPVTRGKVRDVFDLDDSLLIVVTDRLSTFDVVHPTGIPFKGMALHGLTVYWSILTEHIIKNHILTADTDTIIERLEQKGVSRPHQYREVLWNRSMIVRKAVPTPIECVVRGYLAGSAWKEFGCLVKAAGNASTVILHGVELPIDMVESQKLPQPVFTPSTKETTGHDINISAARAREIVGDDLGSQLERASLDLYTRGSEIAESKGLIIGDTKFEFGIYEDKLILIDEVLTPDSSRFWDASLYEPGRSQDSFDKQYLRDYLETTGWDKTFPGPALPEDVIDVASSKYQEAFYRITGEKI